jgi:hypothetical protein
MVRAVRIGGLEEGIWRVGVDCRARGGVVRWCGGAVLRCSAVSTVQCRRRARRDERAGRVAAQKGGDRGRETGTGRRRAAAGSKQVESTFTKKTGLEARNQQIICDRYRHRRPLRV